MSHATPPAIDRYPVPAIRGHATRRFAGTLGLTLVMWIAAWPFFTLGFINHYDSSDAAWIDGLYQRKDLFSKRPAAAGASGGRLVIVGGSNALFGIDAELIERKLGVTTLNYATHAGLGEYILDRARSAIRPGDTVLLSPEYELWLNGATDLSDIEWAYVCTYDKRYIFSRGVAPGLGTLYSQPGLAYWDALRGWRDRYMGFDDGTDGAHNLSLIDSRGDLRSVPPRREFPRQGDLPFPNARSAAGAVGDFRGFARWARANQVRVLYSWPNMSLSSWPRGAPPGAVVAPASTRALLDDLGFVALDEPGDTILPRDWFTDTPYHPDAGCRRVRSERLIRRLRPLFGLPSVPAQNARPAQGVYLVGAQTNWLRPGNTFADPGVEVKYLSPQPLDSPDAITPAGVAALARQGIPIWLDDPAVQAMLPAEQWEFTQVDVVKESLTDWLARYDHHLFLLAHAGAAPPALPSGLGPDLCAALASTKPVAAWMGTGRWAGMRRIQTDARTALLEVRSADLFGGGVPNLKLLARADAEGAREDGSAAQSRVRVNSEIFALATDGKISVAVIDPAQGIMLDAGIFRGDRAETTWSLRRLSLRRKLSLR